jgi:lipopolysaccharide/colanic/teichoic acid biosynthesis glycosyltransferase
VAISTALLLVLAPVLIIAAIAAAIASRGSVLSSETRVSRGRTFELLKFRTLRRGTTGEPRLAERNPANLTWAGRWILKPWYLDELPQLVNVLRGDISLVGPRPWTPAMVEKQVAEGYDYRLRIVAGLTGPAQVMKGVAGASYLEHDLDYVEKCRTLGGWALVRYELVVLLKTLRVIARREGLDY